MSIARVLMSLYAHCLRPLLFRLDAETAHHLTVQACRVAGSIPGLPTLSHSCLHSSAPELVSEFGGLRFSNPIGLAAGWDKSGHALRMLDSLGFGFAEIGSVSARPSPGNPKPRLFRLPQDRAIIVNYGLPNDGAAAVAQRLARHHSQHPLGVNIVKTNDGPHAPPCGPEAILADYERSVSLLHPYAGYLALNLSCPNAQGGKDFFATPGSIASLLARLAPLAIGCPVILKLAPTEDVNVLERVLGECDAFPFVRGFCFNLPSGKPDTLELSVRRDLLARQPGAVAGRPVAALINRCITRLYQLMDRRRYIIIGAGGVFTAEDAYLKIRCGASLVQLYTALIYEGPGVVKHINRGLVELLRRDGFTHFSQAIGTGSSSTAKL
jgi:dihydroorotate dehydrogenase